LEDDIDDELFQSGSVVWVKVAERPWWPTVLFKSWEEARFWGVTPPPGAESRALAHHEVRRFRRHLTKHRWWA